MNSDAGAQANVHDGRDLWDGAGRGRLREPGYLGADGDAAESPDEPLCLSRGQARQAGQIRPLVGERFQCGDVEEHRRPVIAVVAMQRRSDQVADTAGGRQHVLRREQPVIARQTHVAADGHCLAE
ncbi:MAG TPA: hypothetical protein VGJ59_01205 [Jatrophihabitantaceae bacterium]